MGIAIVIPTMNRKASLLQTIRNIAGGVALPDEMIIVDQSSSCEARCACEQAVKGLFSGKCIVEYIGLELPSSTHARNVGLSRATQDVIVFMDDDVDLKKDTIYNVRSLMEDDSVAMLAGIDENMPIARSKLGYIMGTKSIKDHAIGHVTHSVLGRFPDHEVLKETPTQWAMGFFFAVRKSLCNQWGVRFDENLKSYAYAEDLDFTYRYYTEASRRGLRCILSPRIRVFHNGTKEWRISDKKFTYMYVVHRIYLHHKFWKGRYVLMLIWSFIGMYLYKGLHHDNLKDYKEALVFGRKYRNDIINGDMHYELWEKGK